MLASLAMVFGLGCGANGSSDNAMTASIAGQQIEVAAQSTRCYAAGPYGGGVPGYVGASSSPLICRIAFRSQSIFADELSFMVSDVLAVYENYLGNYLPIDNNLLGANLRLQGQEVAIFEGYFAFDRISNVQGGAVCGVYEMRVGAGSDGRVSGRFCTTVEY